MGDIPSFPVRPAAKNLSREAITSRQAGGFDDPSRFSSATLAYAAPRFWFLSDVRDLGAREILFNGNRALRTNHLLPDSRWRSSDIFFTVC